MSWGAAGLYRVAIPMRVAVWLQPTVEGHRSIFPCVAERRLIKAPNPKPTRNPCSPVATATHRNRYTPIRGLKPHGYPQTTAPRSASGKHFQSMEGARRSRRFTVPTLPDPGPVKDLQKHSFGKSGSGSGEALAFIAYRFPCLGEPLAFIA